MISLKFSQKLVLFWFGSILFSLLLLGSVFLFLNKELHQNAVRVQMAEAFDDLNGRLDLRNRYLVRNARLLAERGDIVASLSMIHNYQDPENYQPIVFDVEKKNIAGELLDLLRSEYVDIIAAYDGHMRLSSFAYFDEQKQARIGYLSYKKGRPRYFVSGINLEDYHEVEKLPLWLDLSVDMESEINYQEHVHAHEGSIIMGFHLPVVRQLHNKFEEVVGLITVDKLGSEFAEDISKQAGMGFMFSVNGSGWVSAGYEVHRDKGINVLSDEDLVTGNLNDWHLVSQDGYIYGIANYPLDDGKNIKFVFVFSSSELHLEFDILQQAMLLVLLVNVLLLLPLGVYFLKRTILGPVSKLVMGLESLSKGRYEQLPVSSGKDEVAFLTNSFNSMASAIQIREAELLKLSLVVEQTPISMIITNLESEFEYVNPAFTKITGYSFDEVMGKNTRILQGKETPAETYQQLWQAISNGQEWHGVLHNRKKNGDFIWVSSNIIPIKDLDGKVINYLALNQDITQRKQDEEQLHIQSSALQAAADGIVITDNNGVIQWVNPAYERLTGYQSDDVLGKHIRLLKSGRQDEFYYRELWQTILSGETWNGELYNKRKDGSVYLEEEAITPVLDESGEITHFVAVKRDITAHREQEEIIRQSRKLEAIGQMAGGIAHDFNNLLGILSGNLEILKRFAGDNADMHKWIDSGLKTTKRGAALTKRLLGFSKVSASEVETVSIGSILEDMRPMIDKTAGLKVHVNYGLADDLWLVDIDAGDFEDAVINMVINARDAMQGNGRLDISVYNEMIDEDKASCMPACKAGGHVILCISDSGSGISKEVQQCMFDPFYSSKEKGKGTGLGLSMVHGFIRRSHGYIDVVSEPGAGAAFYIYLPRSAKNQLKEQSSEAKEFLPGGMETILVVDDEPQLVEVASIYLGDLGYRVLQATNTKKAMTFLQGSEKIDLLFSDIVMPGGIDGYELSKSALELRPEIKVLLVSGYTPDTDNLSENIRNLAAMRLSKPYGRVGLAQRIRLVLDGEEKE